MRGSIGRTVGRGLAAATLLWSCGAPLTAMAQTVPARARLTPEAVSPVLGAKLPGDFRLRVLTTPAATPDALDGRVQRGFGGSMVDYYPFGEEGFHLSAGGRLAPKAAPRKDETARLLYAPRQAGVRVSRRMTPAVTMGYSRVVEPGVTLGLEGGMMVGPSDPTLSQRVNVPHMPRQNGANQIVRMAFGYKF